MTVDRTTTDIEVKANICDDDDDDDDDDEYDNDDNDDNYDDDNGDSDEGLFVYYVIVDREREKCP